MLCGEYATFHCDEAFFYRKKSVNRREESVHRHGEPVHPANAHSPHGVGRTQCRKVSSQEQDGSCYLRIESVIHRTLCVNRRKELTLRGKGKAESRVARALELWRRGI